MSFKKKCQLTCGFVLDKSHYMSKSRLCMSIDVHFVLCKFLCVKCQKLAKTLSNMYTGGEVGRDDWSIGCETRLYT